ncbi:MAG TPA: ornithine carbamoyltransferase [Nocardioidaceae bacterium]|nr:ornithine carbamoyltransferase [Nocardioidaceae bacterium]
MIRHFLRDDDLAPAEQAEVLELAVRLRHNRFGEQPLSGPRAVAVLFDKPTLRTQVSFSTGIAQLGGYPLVVDSRLAQIGTRESIADTARVLGRQVAAVVWRTYDQSRIEEMAQYAGVPVVNALTDQFHPCQLLADLMTVRQHCGGTAGVTLAYVGDGANNMAHSYLLAGATAGMHIRIGCPDGYRPDEAVVAKAVARAEATGGSVTVVDDPAEAVRDAKAVATDTWVSMGQEDEKAEREKPFLRYAVTAELLGHAADEVGVLHCLPAYRGKEITADVLDGPRSLVWAQAENRLHAQKALLVWLLRQVEGGRR